MATRNINDTSANSAASDYNTANHVGIPADSNEQATEIVAPAGRLVTREGGSDLGYQDAQGFGGRELL